MPMPIRRLPLAAALAVLPAAAAAQPLEGAAAFGNWRDDAPGIERRIDAGDLPAPSPEASEANGAQPVPRPEGAVPQVADGFDIGLVADGFMTPRALRFAPNGDLFLADSAAGAIHVLRFEGESAEPVSNTVFAEGLNRPYGMAFYPAENPEWLYVGEGDALVRLPYREGDQTANGAPEQLAELPTGGHWTRDVAVSQDGSTIFVAVGSDSNVAEGEMANEPEGGLDAWVQSQPKGAAWGLEEGRAALLAFAPDGSERRLYATGLRNCSGLAIQPATGTPWCAVNERDGLGNDLPFDYATSVTEGAFYGWPWYYIGANPDPRWSGAPREDLAAEVTVPDVLFQSHSAPLGIAFMPGNAWGADYEGDAFVAFHGSWNRGSRTGYKLVRLDFEGGKPTGSYEDFATGMVLSDAEVWGRPVGVAVSPAGDLFFSEDGSGTVWKITPKP